MTTRPVEGTQSIARAFTLLRLLARDRSRGMRLKDVAKLAQLSPATAHRILQQLLVEGAVMQSPGSPHYRIGPLFADFGPAVQSEEIVAACRPALQALSRATQDTIYLMRRSGFDVVCLERIEAVSVIRVMTLDVGDRLTLAESAGGVALLALMSDADVEAFQAARRPELERLLAADPEAVRKRVALARSDGFGLLLGSPPDSVGAISAVVPGPDPSLAISVATITSRLAEPRLSEVKRAITSAVRLAAKQLATRG
jgi:DNA-binding IclR family transcriptional regulator